MRSSVGAGLHPAIFAVDLIAKRTMMASYVGHIDPLLAVCNVLRVRSSTENDPTPVLPENNKC